MIFSLYSFNPRVGINENYKYFIAGITYNNIEIGHPKWAPNILMVNGLGKETIYFNLRLDIGITKFNYMDRLVSGTKPMKGKESKIPIHPVRKNPNRWQLTVR